MITPRKNRPQRSTHRAFTLMELMVVIAIVAVLIGIALPTYERGIAMSDKTGCTSNLRQIGFAITTYAADHGGSLPVMGSNRMLATSKINNGESVTILSEYLGLPTPTVTPVISQTFICPAWRRHWNKTTEGPCYSNVFLLKRASENKRFFPYLSPFGKPGASNTQPFTLAQLNSLSDFSPSLQWAMQDCDQLNYSAASMPGLAPTPVHQTFRNVLFFDMHIEQVNASTILD